MPCRNLRFLVVEDHEFQRNMLAQLLTTLGAEAVHTAQDGTEAMQVLRDAERRVDIVISDLAMPGMDGMELMRHLSDSAARVSVILTSAVDRDLLLSVGSMARAYQVQLLGVMAKPPTAGKLAPLLELHRTGSQAIVPVAPAYPFEEIASAWADDEFEPWFEPQVSLADGAPHGMYAVARWQRPQGTLDQDVFLDDIRSRGLNDDFVWMMLRKSARHCRQWQEQGREVPVTVNIGFETLLDVELAVRIQQIAQVEGLEPRLLVLGITEASLKTDSARGLENLARLRLMGFGLALDDFGGGLMAPEQLSQVAFTQMKIKSTFVTGSDFDASIRAGLVVSLDLARQLRLMAVGSGIRSRQEWTLLHQWGCRLGQGPFIAHPLPGSAVTAWLETNQMKRA